MAIQIHMPALADEASPIVNRGLNAGIEAIWRQHIAVSTADLHVICNAQAVIPEYGSCAWVSNGRGREITVAIDEARIHEQQFPDNLARVVTHDLTHLASLEAGFYPKNLSDALIYEGIAQVSEIGAGHRPAIYSQFKDHDMMTAFAEHAARHLDEAMLIGTPNSPYGRWFFGDQNDARYSRHGGFALGYEIVRGYIANMDLSVAEAITIHPMIMINAWTSGEVKLGTTPLPPIRNAAPFELPGYDRR